MLRGVLLIAFAAVLWSTTSIVAKFLFASSDLGGLTLALLRLMVALPFFWLLMRREQHRLVLQHRQNPTDGPAPLTRLRQIPLKALIPLAGLGIFQAVYQSSYLVAVDLTGAAIATLISLCLPPVFVALLAAPILGEKPGAITLAALFVAIAGTVMLVLSDVETAGTLRLAGILMSLLAAAVYTGFNLTSRYNSARTPVFTTAFLCFFTATLVLLPAVYFSGGFADVQNLQWQHWLMVIYIGVVPTCIAYLCFFDGMQTTPATLASIIVILEPLFVALLAWLILGEELGTIGIAGAFILTVAVVVASRYGNPPRPAT